MTSKLKTRLIAEGLAGKLLQLVAALTEQNSVMMKEEDSMEIM